VQNIYYLGYVLNCWWLHSLRWSIELDLGVIPLYIFT